MGPRAVTDDLGKVKSVTLFGNRTLDRPTRSLSHYTDYAIPAPFLQCTGLFISPSGISEIDCATTKTDTAERSISIGRESLQVFFLY